MEQTVSINPNVINNWKKIMMFARTIVPASNPLKSGNPKSAASTVKERMKRWRAGGVAELWEEAKLATKPRGRKSKKTDDSDQAKSNAKRSQRFISEGQYSRAAQALSSSGMAAPSQANFHKLEEKFPRSEVPDLVPPPDTQPLNLTSA